MKILLVRPRGFCAGVNRAVETLSLLCDRASGPIYAFHEIVHNFWVVDHFRKRGVRFVESLEEIPEGGTVLFSAHGISPAVRERARTRSLKTIDATCPLVARVHQLAKQLARDGFHIFLLGHPGHQEVIGTLGEAPEKMTLVSTAAEARTLPPDTGGPTGTKRTYLMQTTLSDEGWREIVAALRERFPDLIDPPGAGVCFATRNRQEAVRQIAPESDAVLVVGSRNSSNSKRLAELGEKSGNPSYLIDGPVDIDPKWFTADSTILMTAGASAPEEILDLCVKRLAELFDVEVVERVVCEENVTFSAPAE